MARFYPVQRPWSMNIKLSVAKESSSNELLEKDDVVALRISQNK